MLRMYVYVCVHVAICIKDFWIVFDIKFCISLCNIFLILEYRIGIRQEYNLRISQKKMNFLNVITLLISNFF